MPQLDKFIFASQFFWLFLLLGGAYYLLLRHVLPALYGAQRFRQLQMTRLRRLGEQLATLGTAKFPLLVPLLHRLRLLPAAALDRSLPPVPPQPLRLTSLPLHWRPLPPALFGHLLMAVGRSLPPTALLPLLPLLPLLLPPLAAALLRPAATAPLSLSGCHLLPPPPLAALPLPLAGRLLPLVELIRAHQLYGELLAAAELLPPLVPATAPLLPPLAATLRQRRSLPHPLPS